MNTTEVYNNATGKTDPKDDKVIKLQQADAAQKNTEAWAQWRNIPQTKLFLDTLRDVRNKMSIGCAQHISSGSEISNDRIRAIQVEIALLDELCMRTAVSGELKTEMFANTTQQPNA